jgi:hypothetical protein
MRLLLAVVIAVAAPYVASAHNPRAKIVTGVYQSNWGEVTLHQRGKRISGTYVCCGGGVIEGRIRDDGKTIDYTWTQGEDGEAGGRGMWQVVAVGKLDGTWGSGDSPDDGGDWNLVRVSEEIARD